jgi:thiol-disulfide isomerase/thioredoxin
MPPRSTFALLDQTLLILVLTLSVVTFSLLQTGCTSSPTSQASEPLPAVVGAKPVTITAASAVQTPVTSDVVTVLSPAEVLALLPQTKMQPLLLDFTSEYCGECKAIAPVLAAAKKRYATKMSFMAIDVQKMMDAKDSELGRKLLLAIRPMYTPTLIAIAPGGVIVAVETGFKTTPQLEILLEMALPKVVTKTV